MIEQCKGLTKAGNRCKITQGLNGGYCSRHQKQALDDCQDVTIDHPGKTPGVGDERSLADDALEVNKSLSTIVIAVSAILTFIFVWVFKKRRAKRRL